MQKVFAVMAADGVFYRRVTAFAECRRIKRGEQYA